MSSMKCAPFRCLVRPIQRSKREGSREVDVTTNESPRPQVDREVSDSSFHDAEEGDEDVWIATEDSSRGGTNLDGSIYFDAMHSFSHVAAYPPVICTTVPPHPPHVSIDEPETLLRPDEEFHDEAASERAAQAMEGQSRRMLSSNRVARLRRSTRTLRKQLEKPGVVVEERGFPGELTAEEVEAVEKFRAELDKRDPVYSEIVHGFEEVEEEPYALCRYLRARKFNPDHVFQLLDEGKDLWREAKKHNFFPDVEAAIGAPRSVFTSQYPFVYSGRAKNGCPVAYLCAGNIQSEGVQCITTMERVPGYFWNGFMYDFKNQLKLAQDSNPDFVRCECMQVYDLKGLSRAQVNSDALDVIKMANQITTCFPETLHCLVILNAPGFFSFAWKLIKKFVDPRTASKIEVYSSLKQATSRLLELIDEKELSIDYGGGGPSIHDEIQCQANKGAGSRGNVVELMQVNKSGETKFEFDIVHDECMTINVYSRLRAGAQFLLFKGSDLIAKVDVNHAGDGKETYVEPYCKEVASTVKGPGKFHIVGRALSKEAGYFLFVGERYEAKSQ